MGLVKTIKPWISAAETKLAVANDACQPITVNQPTTNQLIAVSEQPKGSLPVI